MDALSLLILLLVLALISLIAVSAINQFQTRKKRVSRQLSQIKRRVEELDEIAIMLDRLLESASVSVELNNEAIELLDHMQQLDPDNQALPVAIENARRLANELNDTNRTRDLNRIQESDAALAKTLFLINEAGRILRKRQSKGKLEISKLEAYIHELSWSYLMVGVTTNVAQGHKCINRGNILRGFAFYKKAQELAIQTSSQDERRHRLIAELSDMMSNRRRYISPDLMPETEFNPSDQAVPFQKQSVNQDT